MQVSDEQLEAMCRAHQDRPGPTPAHPWDEITPEYREAARADMRAALAVLPEPGWQHVSSDGDAHTFRHACGEERTVEGFASLQEAAAMVGPPSEAALAAERDCCARRLLVEVERDQLRSANLGMRDESRENEQLRTELSTARMLISTMEDRIARFEAAETDARLVAEWAVTVAADGTDVKSAARRYLEGAPEQPASLDVVVHVPSADGRLLVPAEVHERGWQWRPTASDTAFAPPFGTIRQCECCASLREVWAVLELHERVLRALVNCCGTYSPAVQQALTALEARKAGG